LSMHNSSDPCPWRGHKGVPGTLSNRRKTSTRSSIRLLCSTIINTPTTSNHAHKKSVESDKRCKTLSKKRKRRQEKQQHSIISSIAWQPYSFCLRDLNLLSADKPATSAATDLDYHNNNYADNKTNSTITTTTTPTTTTTTTNNNDDDDDNNNNK